METGDKLLPSIVEYTDSSGVDVSFANPNANGIFTYYLNVLLMTHMTIIDTDSSGASAPLFNNDVSFEDFKVYSVYDGSSISL